MTTFEEFQKIFIIDETKLSSTLVKALSENKASIYDGVAYWAEGSGKTGIIQHLPFKEQLLQQTADSSLLTSQTATLMSSTLPTSCLLGAIIIQTKYLENKINAVQKVVDQIAQEQYIQNQLFYANKIAEYFSLLKTAKTILENRNLQDSYHFAKNHVLTLMNKRNEILSFLKIVLRFLEEESTTEKHYHLFLYFYYFLLDLLPKGIHLEFLLNCRAKEIFFAEDSLLQGYDDYEELLQSFRNFLNIEKNKLGYGNLSLEKEKSLFSLQDKIKELRQSKENKALLTLPNKRVAKF